MGTRNLTMVISEGKTRIAQYGQWDGYPEGQGLTALNFLLSADLEHFKSQLLKCRFITPSKQRAIDKFLEKIGCKNGWLDTNQAEKYHAKFPLLTRDNGAGILKLIDNEQSKVIWLHNDTDFVADSLFCEWAYVIDLDKGTFEIYKGFNHNPLEETERFFPLTEKNKTFRDKTYYPVRHFKTYSLSELPTVEVYLNEMKVLKESVD
jgi:hypothetical protein